MNYPQESEYGNTPSLYGGVPPYNPNKPGHGSIDMAMKQAAAMGPRAPASGALGDVLDRLYALNAAWDEQRMLLETVMSKVMGPMPIEASGTDKAREPFSRIDDIGLQIDRMTDILRKVQQITGRLSEL